MQYSAVLLAALLPSFGVAAPAAASSAGKAVKFVVRQANGTAPAAAADNGVSDQQIANAVMSWMADTNKVTNFLNMAASMSGDEFTTQATIALNSEKDELNHKQVLDDALGQTQMVQQANEVLANQGTFQAVVDALQQMVNEGPDNAQATVDDINANRCVNVLPNIDMYFAAAGSASVTSVRPTGCLEVDGANVLPTGGVNGSPAAGPVGANPAQDQAQAAPANPATTSAPAQDQAAAAPTDASTSTTGASAASATSSSTGVAAAAAKATGKAM